MDLSFLLHQAVFLFRHDAFVPEGRKFSLMRDLLRWEHETRMPSVDAGGRPSVDVILLSYKRPWNMRPLVRSMLRLSCVSHVFVLNNRAGTSLRLPSDSRLTVVNQSRDTRPFNRFLLPVESKAGYFLSIDDDLFLSEAQLLSLIDVLVTDPAIPHGIVGQQQIGTDEREMPMYRQYVQGENTEVDILNRAYAFTRAHALRYEELLRACHLVNWEEQRDMRYGEDILLSRVNDRRPRIHNFGRFLSCTTATAPGIAQYKEDGFYEKRAELLRRLRNVT